MALNTPISEDFAEMVHSLPLPDADALLAALDTEPSVAIRLNRRKHPVGIDGTPLPDAGYAPEAAVEWCADGRYLAERPTFTLNPLLHTGAFYVQDASSMIHQQVVERIAASLGSTPLSLLDFCAAPGGKTTAMINALPDESVVTANEFIPARGKILRENLEKWGYPAVIATGASADEYSRLPEIFDVVAVDAPCSGEGMMRKDEEARRQWRPGLVAECAALQKDILRGVVRTLRPGGYLIYSTCTFNLEEDELNARFIRDELGLEPVDPAGLGITGTASASPALLPDVKGLRFMQHLTRGEGLFISIFRRPGTLIPYLSDHSAAICASVSERIPPRQDKRGGKKGKERQADSAATNAAMLESLCGWFESRWDMRFEQAGPTLNAIPAAALPLLSALRKGEIRVTAAGLPAAGIKGRDLIPDSRTVLSTAYRRGAFPEVALTEEDSLRYLRRDAIQLPEDTPKGFVTVSYAGLPLGIMKNLGNRANNLFPAPWRIRI